LQALDLYTSFVLLGAAASESWPMISASFSTANAKCRDMEKVVDRQDKIL